MVDSLQATVKAVVLALPARMRRMFTTVELGFLVTRTAETQSKPVLLIADAETVIVSLESMPNGRVNEDDLP